MPPAEWAAQFLRRTITENPFVPAVPTPRQALFLALPDTEILFGGAAGGGKSVALLMAALQFVAVPGYNALLLRRKFTDLYLPDALIPLSHQWLRGTPAKWDGQKHQWTFPSGALLQFGYLDTEGDKYRYQGAAFASVFYDELTQFTQTQYLYVHSRLRKRADLPVPLRVRAASNPGGVGHDWVKERFLDPDNPDRRTFVPSKLEDNPHLDRASYEKSLSALDRVTRLQLRDGDWAVRPEGEMFKRQWFEVVPADRVPRMTRTIRRWDLAATAVKDGSDPDWTAGGRMGIGEDGRYYLMDVRRMRGTSAEVESLVKQTAIVDGTGVSVRIEQEPGSSGKALTEHYARTVLPAFDCRGVPSSGDKVTRARPFSAACERGDVRLVAGAWVLPWLDEVCAFPTDGAHDDQVDVATGGYADLTGEAFDFRILDTAPAPAGPDRPRTPDPDAGWTRAWSRQD